MTKAHLALLIAVGLAVPVIVLQAMQAARLKGELGELRSELAEARRPGKAPRAEVATKVPEKSVEPVMTEGAPGFVSDPVPVRTKGRRSLEEILKLRDPVSRLSGLVAYVEALDERAIPAALAKLRAGTAAWDPEAKLAAQLLLARWGNSDPEGAFSYIAKGGKDLSGDAATILGVLAAKDPKRAAEWLAKPDNGRLAPPWMSGVLASTLAKEWARVDPGAAFSWARALPSGQRTAALKEVLRNLAVSEPSRAAGMALQVEAGSGRAEVIGEIAGTWAERAPEKALEWVLTLQGDERRRGIDRLVEGWSQSAPGDAAAFVDSLAPEEGERLRWGVAGAWSWVEPTAAADWVAGQPESNGKGNALGHVLWNWTVTDAVSAATWLLDQPEGNSRDQAIGSLARATFEDDPEVSVTWSASITDERSRIKSLERGVQAWLGREPEAARAWVNSTDMLTPEEARSLLADGNR